jgi:hypothetical protein
MRYALDNIKILGYPNSFILISNNKPFCYDKYRNFIKESNDACYLFNGECNPPYISEKSFKLDLKVVPFLTHFHTGVHSFSGIYSILYEFIKNNLNKLDYKVAIYENIQKGIVDVLRLFIDDDDIIFLKENILYEFSEVKIIPNSLHSFLENHDISKKISDLILNEISDITYDNYPKKIAILKTLRTSVTSNIGVIDSEIAEKYCQENGYTMLEPNEIGELKLIQLINNCEEIIFSWGTTFMKNFMYLSDNAKNAKVWIIDQPFKDEYYNAINRDIIVKKYKNCNFEYIIKP